MKLLPVILLLVSCSCSHVPVDSAQHDLQVLHNDFSDDMQRKYDYSKLPVCGEVLVHCMTFKGMYDITLLSYDAQDALTRAAGERTAAAIAKAREKVGVFTKAAKALPGVAQ